MRARKRAAAAVMGLGVLGVVTGCGGSGSPRAAAAPLPASASVSPAAAAPAPSSAAPAPVAAPADVRDALLSLSDLPAGYAVATGSQAAVFTASSTSATCKDLVALLNRTAEAGAAATATVDLDGGAYAAMVQERLDAFTTPGPAVDALVQESAAVHTCPQVTLKVPHYGRATFAVAQISFDPGAYGYAARLTATSPELDGLELVIAGAALDGVAVHVVTDDDAGNAEQTVQGAVAKVHAMFGGSNT